MIALLLLSGFGGILLAVVGIRHRHNDTERHFWWALVSIATAILAIGVGIGFFAGGVTDTTLWDMVALITFIYVGSSLLHIRAYAEHWQRDSAALEPRVKAPEPPKAEPVVESNHAIWRGGGYHLQ